MGCIVFREVVKSYGHKVALRGVSFRVSKESIAALLGPNGAGKTTTLKIAMGLIRRDYGDVEVLGFDPWVHPEIREHIGFVPENPQLPPVKCYTLLEHIARVKGVDDVDREVLKISKMLDIRRLLDVNANKLSAGLKQRVAIALSLIGNPQLLIMDEPLSNIDPKGRVELIKFMRNLKVDYGVDMLISTHILAEAQELVDYLIVISKGLIVAEGKLSDLTRRFKEPIRVKFKVPRGLTVEKLVKEVLREVDVLGFEIEGNTVEFTVTIENYGKLRMLLEERGLKILEEKSRDLTRLYSKLVGE